MGNPIQVALRSASFRTRRLQLAVAARGGGRVGRIVGGRGGRGEGAQVSRRTSTLNNRAILPDFVGPPETADKGCVWARPQTSQEDKPRAIAKLVGCASPSRLQVSSHPTSIHHHHHHHPQHHCATTLLSSSSRWASSYLNSPIFLLSPFFSCSPPPFNNRLHLGASLPISTLWFILVASALAVAATTTLTFTGAYPDTISSNPNLDADTPTMPATAELAPGRPGNLTPEQEEKLCEFWVALLKLCGITDPDGSGAAAATPIDAETTPPPSSSSVANTPTVADDGAKQKKKRMGLFSRKQSSSSSTSSLDSKNSKVAPSSSDSTLPADDPEDKYGQTRQFYETLATMSQEQLHETIWAMVKHDHPDALCLRFLRARKWDVQKALIMMISTMNWRSTQMHVDSDIMKRGEAGMIADLQSDDPKTKKIAADFLHQMRQGKTFIHGVDKKGSPVCIVRVRLHKIGEQSEEGLERFTVYLIETARMMLRPPVDTATMVFDLSGFSMANMDYTPVKFIIKCFEANYPESLASVLVHRAPWVFQGIWKMIRGWLDPVVANKITFTNNLKELEEFIPADRIPKELDGPEDWEYRYVEPAAGENDKMKDTATRDRLQEARNGLVHEYVKATLEWTRAGADQAKVTAIKKRREDLAAQLRASYWELDPYVRARSLFDRVGIMQGEKMDFYPQKEAPKVETSVDDLD